MRWGLAALVFAGALASAPRWTLTIDNIMQGPALFGYEPAEVRWSGDSQHVYFSWKHANEARLKDPDTYAANRDGSGLRKLTEEESRLAPPFGGDLSRDRNSAVYVRNGDLFVYDEKTGKTRQVTQTAEPELNPHFLPDGKRIYFTRANNLYLLSLEDASLRQMTDIRAAGTPPPADEKKGTDSQEFVKKEEAALSEVVKERAAKRKEQEEKRKKESGRKPYTLAARQTVTSLELTPDERFVVASLSDAAEGTKTTVVPNFLTESGYTEDIPGRTKVGDRPQKVRMAVFDARTGEMKWVDHGLHASEKSTETKTEAKGAANERAVQFLRPVFSDDGTKAVVLARSADNKDRWVLALDPVTAKTRVLVDQHDNAWIDGPGAMTLGFVNGDSDVYFQSEKTGYSQLYSVAYAGGEPKALTSGNWEVTNVELSRDRKTFYLTTGEVSPYERHIYSMSTDGGARTKLTSTAGNHRGFVSPDGATLADLYSFTTRPPELFVMEAKQGAAETKITDSPAPEFWTYPWQDAPIVQIPARDGAKVPARLFVPQGARSGGPAVVFVHGAGYLQNVHRGWSQYAHEYLFHHFLMEHGYTVVDLDYRGSAGYGRDWRTAIYRHMGGKDLDDQVDAARWLTSEHGIDPKRIGIYGGSYGGFITLMAMFTQPDVFAAGAALRPVTDWAHYNHGYTANILNMPQEDAEAYRVSSPIYFAQGLKGALLICHGMIDTNVHFQDTVRLVQRLIELHKDNWEVAPYPVEDHGFVEPSSWADEYKRIFALYEKNLKGPPATVRSTARR